MKRLLFIAIPILEILLFVKIGSLIGVLGTLASILITATLGLFLIKNSGVANIFRPRDIINQKDIPLNNFFRAICHIIAGILLIIPGYITDLIGLLLLIPLVRKIIKFLPLINIFFGEFSSKEYQKRRDEKNTIEGVYNEINLNDKD
ncbi:MAG: FxsA protein [Rhodospirillaceae bacterium]|nr:FxsA protein [Rhodospirillaceae bacterium]|tara:strand:+ start:2367 stop:2807 length:441 start_codon:yes stop_codon:yes gene_type:complete